MREHDSEITDIRASEISQFLKVFDKDVFLRIQNVNTGIISGKRIVLDEIVIDNMINGIISAVKGASTKYFPIPSEIIIRNELYNEQSLPSQNNEPQALHNNDIVESFEPRFSLSDIALNESVRKKINTALTAVINKEKLTEDWGIRSQFGGNRAIILNFYGKSGTGKSMTAEAIAKELGKKVYRVNYAELESKYVGETPKNIRQAFATATWDDAVLIFDEADSFLGKRLTSVTQSADYGVNITRSVMLMELEKFSGVVVFTTNLIGNYDSAFKRRILLSIYFEMPDIKAREQIWSLHLGNKMPRGDNVSPETLAKRYDNISGADIKDIVFFAALRSLEQDKKAVELEDFDYAHLAVIERYDNVEKPVAKEDYEIESISEEQYLKETGLQ